MTENGMNPGDPPCLAQIERDDLCVRMRAVHNTSDKKQLIDEDVVDVDCFASNMF